MTALKQHKVFAADATATDEGVFEAIASTWDLDRQGERIARGAFAKTIRQWQASSKRLPLHWNHSDQASDVVGVVDPAAMRETSEGLHIEGRLDLQDSATAAEVWRLMRSDSVGLSIGYMTTKQHEEKGGVNVLDEVDLFEITITTTPANAGTRVVSMKNLGGGDSLSVEELRAELVEAGVPGARRKSADREPVRVASFEVETR